MNSHTAYEDTMAELGKTYNVFISHAAKDSAIVHEIASILRESGLDSFTDNELAPGADWSDAIWEALAESRALIAIVSPSGSTPRMGIEIGAARAWHKPIYAVVTDPSATLSDPALAGIPLYTTGRLEDVIRLIRASAQQLSEEDRLLLVQLYSQMDISVDQLTLDPRQLETLVKNFARRSGKAVDGELLLSELLRLHKQGRLNRNGPSGPSTPKPEPD
jgi:DNA polymerase III psi subunit